MAIKVQYITKTRLYSLRRRTKRHSHSLDNAPTLTRNATSRKRNALYLELIETSSISVTPYFDDKGLRSIIITIEGPAANLPSSNQKKIIPVNGRRVIVDDTKAKYKLEALTKLFHDASNLRELKFGKQEVFLQVINAERKGCWDSHNIPKMLCDWIEDRGIVDNDSQIEVWPTKKVNYTRYFKDAASTTIIIQRRDLVSSLLEETQKELEQVARKAKTLIG